MGSSNFHKYPITVGPGSITGLTPLAVLFGKSDGTVQQTTNFEYDPSTGILSLLGDSGSHRPALYIENNNPAALVAPNVSIYDSQAIGAFFGVSVLNGSDLYVSTLEVSPLGVARFVADNATLMKIEPSGTTPGVEVGATGKYVKTMGNLQLQEGMRLNNAFESGAYVVQITDHTLTFDDNSTYDLPDISTAIGCEFWFICTAPASLVINPDGTDTINGASSQSFPSQGSLYAVRVFAPDNGGTDWSMQVFSASTNNAGIGYQIDGGGAVITTGTKAVLPVPYNMTLTGWIIYVNGPSGSIEIDIKKSTYADYPTTASMCNGNEPFISSDRKNDDYDLSDWSTVLLSSTDAVEIVVNSVTSIERATIMLLGQRL